MRKVLRFCTGMAAIGLVAACGGEEREATLADGPVEDFVEATPDEAHMIIGGSVVSTTPSSFLLDYGPDTLTVEVDDWDAFPEGRALDPGDRVTVSGRVDSDLALAKSIEASSVYVHNLGTSFHAAPADEEEAAAAAGPALILHPRNVDVTGRVTGISGDELVLGPANDGLRVDTAGLPDNPFDAEGRRVKVGDRVYVWGDLVFAGRDSQLHAEGLVTLGPDWRAQGLSGGQGNRMSAPGGNSANATGAAPAEETGAD